MPTSFLRRVPRQPGVGVERDAVADRRQQIQRADLHGEARVRRAAQQAVEFLDLSALALPAHPRLLAGVPAPLTMEEKEAVPVRSTQPIVQGLDPRTRRLDHRGVARQLAARRVDHVAQEREMNARIHVPDRHDLQALEQFLDVRDGA